MAVKLSDRRAFQEAEAPTRSTTVLTNQGEKRKRDVLEAAILATGHGADWDEVQTWIREHFGPGIAISGKSWYSVRAELLFQGKVKKGEVKDWRAIDNASRAKNNRSSKEHKHMSTNTAASAPAEQEQPKNTPATPSQPAPSGQPGQNPTPGGPVNPPAPERTETPTPNAPAPADMGLPVHKILHEELQQGKNRDDRDTIRIPEPEDNGSPPDAVAGRVPTSDPATSPFNQPVVSFAEFIHIAKLADGFIREVGGIDTAIALLQAMKDEAWVTR